MKIINREMGGEKTTALVELMLAPGNDDVIYVAPTLSQAHRIAYEYARRIRPGISRDRFISLSQLDATRAGGRYPVPRFVLDEIDGILGALTGGKVIAVAGTDEDLKAGQMARMREN